MTFVTVDEAADQLPERIREAGIGAEIMLTRNGLTVLTIHKTPALDDEAEVAGLIARIAAVEEILRMREENQFVLPEGMTIGDLIRRSRSR